MRFVGDANPPVSETSEQDRERVVVHSKAIASDFRLLGAAVAKFVALTIKETICLCMVFYRVKIS